MLVVYALAWAFTWFTVIAGALGRQPMLVVLGPFLVGALWVSGIFDAYRTAEKMNQALVNPPSAMGPISVSAADLTPDGKVISPVCGRANARVSTSCKECRAEFLP
ncbi:MAG TPA: hypothetical protein VGL99_15500 [Chloroflexota bacterium]